MLWLWRPNRQRQSLPLLLCLEAVGCGGDGFIAIGVLAISPLWQAFPQPSLSLWSSSILIDYCSYHASLWRTVHGWLCVIWTSGIGFPSPHPTVHACLLLAADVKTFSISLFFILCMLPLPPPQHISRPILTVVVISVLTDLPHTWPCSTVRSRKVNSAQCTSRGPRTPVGKSFTSSHFFFFVSLQHDYVSVDTKHIGMLILHVKGHDNLTCWHESLGSG